MKFIVLSNNIIFCIFPSVLKFKPLFPPPVDFSHTYDIWRDYGWTVNRQSPQVGLCKVHLKIEIFYVPWDYGTISLSIPFKKSFDDTLVTINTNAAMISLAR